MRVVNKCLQNDDNTLISSLYTKETWKTTTQPESRHFCCLNGTLNPCSHPNNDHFTPIFSVPFFFHIYAPIPFVSLKCAFLSLITFLLKKKYPTVHRIRIILIIIGGSAYNVPQTLHSTLDSMYCPLFLFWMFWLPLKIQWHNHFRLQVTVSKVQACKARS